MTASTSIVATPDQTRAEGSVLLVVGLGGAGAAVVAYLTELSRAVAVWSVIPVLALILTGTVMLRGVRVARWVRTGLYAGIGALLILGAGLWVLAAFSPPVTTG